MAQDTERTRPRYDAEVIKEIFIVVQTETMNFINVVDRNNEFSGQKLASFPGLQSPYAVEGLVKLIRRMTSGRRWRYDRRWVDVG